MGKIMGKTHNQNYFLIKAFVMVNDQPSMGFNPHLKIKQWLSDTCLMGKTEWLSMDKIHG